MLIKRLLGLNLLFVEDGSEESTTGGSENKEEETVDSAVEKAAKDLENKDKKDEKDESDEDSEEDKEDSEEDKDDDDSDDSEDDLTEEQDKQAKSIYKLLSNPDTAIKALETLAAQAGLKLDKIETKKEEKEAKLAIKDIIKAKLGTNYPHLADVLGDTLQELFDTQVKEGTKDIREKLAESERGELKKTIVAAQEKVISEYVDVPNKVLAEFVRMQEAGEITPGPKQPPDKFIRAGIREASENLNIKLIRKTSSSSDTKKNEESSSRKKESPLDKLASKSRNSAESGKDGVRSTQVKNMNDAIRLGVEAVEKQMKKG